MLYRIMCFVSIGIAVAAAAGAERPIQVLPIPSHGVQEQGSLFIDPGFTVQDERYDEPRLDRALQRFRQSLSARTGITVWNTTQPSAVLHIVVAGPSRPIQQVGEDESYELVIDSRQATIHASNPLGAMHALQTVLQLVQLDARGFYLPAVRIDDKPRFPWRGLMIDTSRHFIPVEVLKSILDGMEAAKLNVFHWHLSDDQGFRAQSHLFPLLTQRGSDGLFYTQSQMREIVAYARDRGIRVVPEIDMPAHVSAILAAYPEVGSAKGSYAIERKWGIFNPALDPSREETYRFLDRLLGELMPIFPDAYFHIGGDECNGKEWLANPRIRAFMEKHDLQTTAALQAYFSSRVEQIVLKHGKIPIGWDEVLQPGVSAKIAIQSWHGSRQLAEAARAGHKVILSKGYYLDLNLPAGDHYAVDPLGGDAAELSPEQQQNILGGEAAMWTEYVSEETVESRIWPRAAAIAEKLWSPASETTNLSQMYMRLASFSRELEERGIYTSVVYRRMLARIANEASISTLKTLADVEEPPKQHERAHMGQYTSFTPLNRTVDAIRPESRTGRAFRAICDDIVSGEATTDEYAKARSWLVSWRDDEAKLSPVIQRSALANELGPASAALRDEAEVGLYALDHIQGGEPVTHEWKVQASGALKIDAEPHATMILSISNSVKQLLNSCREVSGASPGKSV